MKKLLITTALISTVAASSVLAHDKGRFNTYHVTIKNTTAHHIITPPVVIAHNHKFKLFELGNSDAPASSELATLAETGNNAPLVESLEYDDNVSATATGGGIPPGSSITIEIEAPKRTLFSVTGMLATTNDAIMAVRNVKAPRKHRTTHVHGMTYDAGSEMNNEDCNYIPGPPCNNGSNLNHPGEGFVTIHNGVFGKMDLIPSNLDWRGPTAVVSIHNDN